MKTTLNYSLLMLCTLMISISSSEAGNTISKNKHTKAVNNTGHSVNKLSLVNDYSFSQTTGTYNNLTGSTSINNNQLWDDPTYTIPIGFNFQLFNTIMDSAYFGTGVGGLVSSFIDANFEADFYIFAFEADLIDRGDLSGTSQSPISYKLEGLPGSRILKIEWKNAGFFSEGDLLGTLNDFVNFQLWLYEGTNNIEFHYGTSSLANASIDYDGETGALIGLSDNFATNPYFLSGIPSAATQVDSVVFINGTPANGTIYKFTKLSTGIQSRKINTAQVLVYPNPITASSIIQVTGTKVNDADLTIMDVYGRRVYSQNNIQSNRIELSKANFQSGIYFYTLSDNGKLIATGKINKD